MGQNKRALSIKNIKLYKMMAKITFVFSAALPGDGRCLTHILTKPAKFNIRSTIKVFPGNTHLNAHQKNAGKLILREA